jgi:hypothetical protein
MVSLEPGLEEVVDGERSPANRKLRPSKSVYYIETKRYGAWRGRMHFD